MCLLIYLFSNYFFLFVVLENRKMIVMFDFCFSRSYSVVIEVRE